MDYGWQLFPLCINPRKLIQLYFLRCWSYIEIYFRILAVCERLCVFAIISPVVSIGCSRMLAAPAGSIAKNLYAIMRAGCSVYTDAIIYAKFTDVIESCKLKNWFMCHPKLFNVSDCLFNSLAWFAQIQLYPVHLIILCELIFLIWFFRRTLLYSYIFNKCN